MPFVYTPLILAPYAALLALLFAWLSLRVAMMRGKERKNPGAIDAALFDRASRVQANFVEYVPFAVILLVLVAGIGTPLVAVNGLATLLLLARIAHVYGLLIEEPTKKRYLGRLFGMLGTMLVFLGCAVLLLLKWVNIVWLSGHAIGLIGA